jgi:hypothetical protein
MARKPRNRLELRRQHEATEPADPMEDETQEEGDAEAQEEAKPKRKAKPKAAAPKRTRATKAAKPAARMRVVWQVVNDAFKVVATFEYPQRAAADAKAAEMIAKGKGNHFVQKVKEAMTEDAPGLGANVPRTAPAVAKTAAKPAPSRSKAKAAVVVEEDEEPDDGDDDIDEPDDDDE